MLSILLKLPAKTEKEKIKTKTTTLLKTQERSPQDPLFLSTVWYIFSFILE